MRWVTAILRKTSSDDGMIEMEDDIPLGKNYEVDLDSIKVSQMLNTTLQREHSKELIKSKDGGWLPTELLFIPGHTTTT